MAILWILTLLPKPVLGPDGGLPRPPLQHPLQQRGVKTARSRRHYRLRRRMKIFMRAQALEKIARDKFNQQLKLVFEE